jgi:hypothetical protein
MGWRTSLDRHGAGTLGCRAMIAATSITPAHYQNLRRGCHRLQRTALTDTDRRKYPSGYLSTPNGSHRPEWPKPPIRFRIGAFREAGCNQARERNHCLWGASPSPRHQATSGHLNRKREPGFSTLAIPGCAVAIGAKRPVPPLSSPEKRHLCGYLLTRGRRCRGSFLSRFEQLGSGFLREVARYPSGELRE